MFSNPVFGITAVMAGFLAQWIEALTPIMKFVALVVGVMIGFVTLYKKIQEARLVRHKVKGLPE